MSNGLVKHFRQTATGLLTALTAIAPISAFSQANAKAEADREAISPKADPVLIAQLEEKLGIERKNRLQALLASKGKAVMHYGDSYIPEQMAGWETHMNNINCPTEVFSGEPDPDRATLYVNGKKIAVFTGGALSARAEVKASNALLEAGIIQETRNPWLALNSPN